MFVFVFTCTWGQFLFCLSFLLGRRYNFHFVISAFSSSSELSPAISDCTDGVDGADGTDGTGCVDCSGLNSTAAKITSVSSTGVDAPRAGWSLRHEQNTPKLGHAAFAASKSISTSRSSYSFLVLLHVE